MSENIRLIGEHKLATEYAHVPPERAVIKELQKRRTYKGYEAVLEAANEGLLRENTRHAELSPTFKCPEDCGGCMDRVSLHENDPPEATISPKEWLEVVDNLEELGVDYFMLIGGTIDRHPATSMLMKHILDKNSTQDVGWFTDGIMLQNAKTGMPTKVFERLKKEGRMLETTTHVSADYLVPAGAENTEGEILDPTHRWENEYGGSRYYKSAFGERLARNMITAKAKRVVLNTAISSHNIHEVVRIYDYVSELQEYAAEIGSPTVVLHTFSPWTHRPHMARGDDPRNYDLNSLLTEKHRERLEEISRYMLSDTYHRIENELPRVAANSSGFITGLPDFAITQDVSYTHGSSELAVQPDGTVRIDPIFVSAKMLEHAKNPYGYRDRDMDHNPFNHYSHAGFQFPNLIQSTRGAAQWR